MMSMSGKWELVRKTTRERERDRIPPTSMESIPIQIQKMSFDTAQLTTFPRPWIV